LNGRSGALIHPDRAPADVRARLRKVMEASLTADPVAAEQAARPLQ
jgi:hypothetical protein